MQIDPSPRGEHTSASNAAADALCAGRHLFQRGIPDEKSSDAEFGTEIHDALAKQDPSKLKVGQREIYDACLDIEARKVKAYLMADPLPAPVRERRYWCKWADGLQHSGQIDCAYRSGTKAIIIEYKTLSGEVVESPKNLQLRDQVSLYEADTQLLNEVAVVVVQPLATHTPELTVYSKADIRKARGDMYLRVAASNKPDAPRTAGELQCKWCRAKTKCAEYNRWAGAGIVPAHVEESLLSVPVSEWTPQQRVLFMDRLPVAQKWLDECKASMKRLLSSDPRAIPGYGLKPGVRRETITNAQAVFEGFSTKGGSLEQFMGCINVGKTKLKETLAVVTKEKGKALEASLCAVIGGNSSVKESEPSVERLKQ